MQTNKRETGQGASNKKTKETKHNANKISEHIQNKTKDKQNITQYFSKQVQHNKNNKQKSDTK